MKGKQFLIIFCAAILLAGGLYYFAKDEPLPPPKPVQEAVKPSDNLSLMGNSLLEEKDGKRLWEINATEILYDANTKNIVLKTMKGTFYKDNGAKIDLVANQAVMDNDKNIFLEGDIKAVSSDDGATFTAPKGKWDARQRKFFGSGGIQVTRDDTVITGQELETDANMEKSKVQGNALIRKGVKQP